MIFFLQKCHSFGTVSPTYIMMHSMIDLSNCFNVYCITEIPKVHLQISSEFEPVTYGSKIVVEAQIQSCPRPTAIQWWKNEEDITPDGRTILEDNLDVQNPKLIIRSVDYSGDVKYGITVTNDLGSVQNHKSLKVVGTQNS